MTALGSLIIFYIETIFCTSNLNIHWIKCLSSFIVQLSLKVLTAKQNEIFFGISTNLNLLKKTCIVYKWVFLKSNIMLFPRKILDFNLRSEITVRYLTNIQGKIKFPSLPPKTIYIHRLCFHLTFEERKINNWNYGHIYMINEGGFWSIRKFHYFSN